MTQNAPPLTRMTPGKVTEVKADVNVKATEEAPKPERIIVDIRKVSPVDQKLMADPFIAKSMETPPQEEGGTPGRLSFLTISAAARHVRKVLDDTFDYRMGNKPLAEPPPSLVNTLAMEYGRARVKRD